MDRGAGGGGGRRTAAAPNSSSIAAVVAASPASRHGSTTHTPSIGPLVEDPRLKALLQALDDSNAAAELKDDFHSLINQPFTKGMFYSSSKSTVSSSANLSQAQSALKRVISKKLADEDEDEKTSRNWNSEFQEILEGAFFSEDVKLSKYEKAIQRTERLQKVLREFSATVARISRQIIDGEIAKEESSDESVSGERYQAEGILFKLARTSEFYGGQTDVTKIMNNELRGLNAILNSEVRGISIPLSAVCELRGFRIMAVAKVPISQNTLKIGLTANSDYITTYEEEIVSIISKLGKCLRLTEHLHRFEDSGVKVRCSAGLEIHKGKDQRLYVCNAGRLLPPTSPLVCLRDGEEPFDQFRPEFTETYVKPLCPDAFSSGLIDEKNDMNIEVHQASKYLLEHRLGTLLKKIAHNFKENMDYFSYRDLFHSFGVNMRYLGVARMTVLTSTSLKLAEKIKVRISYSLLEEIIIRTLKSAISRKMREKHEAEADDGLKERSTRKVFVEYVNLLMGHKGPTKEFSAAYDRFWTRELKILIREKYPVSLTEAEFDGATEDDLRTRIDRWYIFKTLVNRFQITLKSESLSRRFNEVEELRKEWLQALKATAYDNDPLKIQETLKLLKKNFDQFQDQIQDALPQLKLKPLNLSSGSPLLETPISIDDFQPLKKARVTTLNLISSDIAKAVLLETIALESEESTESANKRILLLEQAIDRFQQVLILKPHDLKSLTLLPLCLSKLALESTNSWNSEKLCDKADDLLRKALELNPEYFPSLLELARTFFVRSKWKLSIETLLPELISSLTLLSSSKMSQEMVFDDDVNINASFIQLRNQLFRRLVDCLQSLFVTFFFKLSGAKDEKFLSTTMESSSSFFDQALAEFEKEAVLDSKNLFYLGRAYMVKFLYARQYFPEQSHLYCEKMLRCYDQLVHSPSKLKKAVVGRHQFERAMALYFSAITNGDSAHFIASAKEFDTSQQSKPFLNIQADQSLIWKYSLKSEEKTGKTDKAIEIAPQFATAKNVSYNSEGFAQFLSGSLTFGNKSLKSWEGKAFFSNLKKSIDVLELDKNAQFAYVYTVFVSLTDNVVNKGLVSKVNFFMQKPTEMQKITRTPPELLEFTAVGTEAHPVKIEIHLNPPFDGEPLLIDFDLQLEPPGTSFSSQVLFTT